MFAFGAVHSKLYFGKILLEGYMEPTLNMFYGISIIVAAIAFLFAAYLYVWVKRQSQENKRISEVAQLIRGRKHLYET